MTDIMAGADARMAHYDEAKTVDYQIRQLPTESTFSSPEWEEIFSPFRLSKPAVERQHHASGATNLTWTIDPSARRNGAYVDYDEFGYDKDGYLCKLEADLTPGVRRAGRSGPTYRSNDFGHRTEISEHIVSSFSLLAFHGHSNQPVAENT